MQERWTLADEKITANEWDSRRKCPICSDIADKKINLDGEEKYLEKADDRFR